MGKAPQTRLPKLNARLGERIEVRIKTSGMKNISAITLMFRFDPTILKHVKTVMADDLVVEGTGFHNIVPLTPNLAEWRFAWSQIEPMGQVPNESLATLQFDCIKTGTSQLTWSLDDTDKCEYADVNAEKQEESADTYINGYVYVTE